MGSNPIPSATFFAVHASKSRGNAELLYFDYRLPDEQGRLGASRERTRSDGPVGRRLREERRRRRAEQLCREAERRGQDRGDAHQPQAYEAARSGQGHCAHGLHGWTQNGHAGAALPLRRRLHAAPAVRPANRSAGKAHGRRPGGLRGASGIPGRRYDLRADHPRVRQVLQLLHHPLPTGT